MRQVAITISVIGFFVLAFVGWFSDVPMFTCGLRALAGAGVLYVVVTLAGTTALRVFVHAMMAGRVDNSGAGRTDSESAD